MALPPAPAFREDVNVLFPGAEEIEEVQSLPVNDQLIAAQFEEGMRLQQSENCSFMPGEEFQQFVVMDVARGNQQELGRPLTKFVRDLEVRVLGDQNTVVLICEVQKNWILRAVLLGEVQSVNHFVPALLKPEREPVWQLGINQELHAARGRMR